MIKALGGVCALVVLAFVGGCTPANLNTSPGSELPRQFDVCQQNDEIGRCKKWKYGSGQIRPYDIPPGYKLVPN